ncbi:hypothetical protein [Limnoglobus roseus]|uniref:Cytochrome c domain-containing protein n=1 Tax=Limnoglobus roseus TaxID=2598579 RepID=A0A5C1A9Q5_9BACT|nr:hypothetical protein [Limnoglobus roseus]QEL15931.1 hypothetical protein PX52LOC_02867 [Limnoglobus roseus]
MFEFFRLSLVLAATVVFATVPDAAAQTFDYDQAPIRYAKAAADNPVSRLQAAKPKLAFDDDHGYLKSALAALKVPESSQLLVFSKTSLQRQRITAKTPRAVYFNDDVYVGFTPLGDVLEVSVADAALGTVYYTIDQEPAVRPRFVRQTESCLTCHGASPTRGVPGHLMRSVFADRGGEPLLANGSYRTDDASPFAERWGGWYVTGTHGKQEHLGNRWHKGRSDDADPVLPGGSQNVTDLKPFFTVNRYLTPHSDIVALMVLGHQTTVHNRIARATYETRVALHYQDELNRALKEPATTRYDSVKSRIASVGDDLLKGLLFCEEAKLTDAVKGTSGFAEEFAARGPFDKAKRSLRDFDLKTQLFRYPCSFLIYSEAFDKMPGEVREYVLRKLFDVLIGRDKDAAFKHLTADDRRSILEILRETKPTLPAYWRKD